MVLLEFSMMSSTQEEHKRPYVARILDVTDCFKTLEVDCPRISSQIKIDHRAGQNSRMKSEIDAVETILGRKLST